MVGKGYTSDPSQAFWQNTCHEYAGKFSGYTQKQRFFNGFSKEINLT